MIIKEEEEEEESRLLFTIRLKSEKEIKKVIPF